MERADLVAIENSLREAFIAAASDVRERRTVAGRAFLVGDRAVGQFQERAGVVRARLWLADRERAAFEARPTFDRESGWLHVVSEDDVRFVADLVPAAYRAASSGKAAPPSASSVEIPTSPDLLSDEKRKGAASPRRPSARSSRPR